MASRFKTPRNPCCGRGVYAGFVPFALTIVGWRPMGYRTYTCPIAKSCGGCEWLEVSYPIQLERKQALVEEVLGQAAQEDRAHVDEIRGMDDPRGYRYKAATPFAPGSRGRVRCGFYSAGTHRIVPCASCLVEAPGIRETLNAVARTAERCGIPAYQEDRGTGVLRHAVIRMGWVSRERLLTIVTNGPRIPRMERFVDDLAHECPKHTSIVQNINERQTNAILGRRCSTLRGRGFMRDRLLGCDFGIGPTSFYQTNPQQTEVLYRLAIAGAGVAPGTRLLDAYCGTGTIGICAAKSCNDVEVVGVEQVAGAVAAARRNCVANGLDGRCRFVRADATEYLVAAARNGRAGCFDALVMDPPRAGSTPEFLSAVCALKPERVSYVSCNVLTQARDVELLREGGYRLERVQPVDMFPHTRHVECIATLVRR